MSARRTPVTGLPALVGEELGVSDWRDVSAATVTAFAEITGDRQWIHVDAERAAAGPFGAPVAHGFLLMSMVPAMLSEVVDVIGADHVVNKGVSDVRLLSPVRVGDRVRGRVRVARVRPRPRGFWETDYGVELAAEGSGTPALRMTLTLLYHVE
ncbi:MaoC/PaaZ C-terminal domain-containing protein [Actinoplanes teichomyceticus]|uniref:Acyl dehydratase n=1 Tax=Actinoplanes teichomyceticus TaxID=1867 RepID=A0A561WLP8_ACTTI|nr:MaoC/PaaZ C-terminal domain-containing protein [Actinoplanes teichomyceticus]TWG24794.1 acyl dehydratase [Actinoplanes teichomyceticus]GIF14544.1 hypothetical protein Ate01nite_45760 [Actinoplanes teichomyceticus]